MSRGVSFSADFLGFVGRAGYAVSPPDESGATILLSSPGGEVRYFVRVRADGWFELTRASRGGGEQLELRAVSLDVIERYLAGQFGAALREVDVLPVLKKPWTVNDVASGYSVTEPFSSRSPFDPTDGEE